MKLQTSGLRFSIGADVCHIPRISRLVFPNVHHSGSRMIPSAQESEALRDLARFNRRLFTEWEERLFWYRYREAPAFRIPIRMNQYLAGRWAAKEAVIKALATFDRVTFRQIEIRPHPTTKVLRVFIWAPGQYLTRETTNTAAIHELDDAQKKFEAMVEQDETIPNENISMQNLDISVSVSHDGNYAFATAMAVQTGP